MKESDFKIMVEGSGAGKSAEALAEFIRSEFGFRAEPVSPPERPEREKVVFRGDPLTLAALIISIPAAVLAVVDLVDRLKKKKKTDELLRLAAGCGSAVTIITPDGTVIHLNKEPAQTTDSALNAASGKILDAANQAAALSSPAGQP